MRARIVCGFLGAGKTTFLLHHLRSSAGRTAVLVNEFGDVGVDGTLLAGRQVNVLELPGGCICCSLRGNLVEAVLEIRQRFAPELLLIEPSGIAAPSGILEALADPRLADLLTVEAVVGIVDATSFLEYYEAGGMGGFFLDQVRNSDILLLNKCDLAGPEVLTACERLLGELNPAAVLVRTVYCRARLPLGARRRPVTPHPFAPDLQVVVLTPRVTLPRRDWQALGGELDNGDFGTVLRAKGLVRAGEGMAVVNYVPGQAGWERWPGVGKPRLVFIGRRLREERLRVRLGEDRPAV